MNTADTRRFGGISRLFGTEGFEKLQNAHVVVVGLGGVGSWVAEALARTAIGRLTLVDGDTVEESNTNRQMPAMDGQYGRLKTEVMAERLRAINPDARIEVVSTFVTTEVTALKNGAAPAGLNAIQQSAADCNANVTGVVGAVQDTITAEAKGDLFGNVQKVVTGQMTAAEAVESAMKLN